MWPSSCATKSKTLDECAEKTGLESVAYDGTLRFGPRRLVAGGGGGGLREVTRSLERLLCRMGYDCVFEARLLRHSGSGAIFTFGRGLLRLREEVLECVEPGTAAALAEYGPVVLV